MVAVTTSFCTFQPMFGPVPSLNDGAAIWAPSQETSMIFPDFPSG